MSGYTLWITRGLVWKKFIVELHIDKEIARQTLENHAIDYFKDRPGLKWKVLENGLKPVGQDGIEEDDNQTKI